ncbi:MAG: hypothetical protein WBF81_06595 [Thermoplasmata archaeon]
MTGSVAVLLLAGGAWASTSGLPGPFPAANTCAIPFAPCYITLSTPSGSHGNRVTITGSGFYPGVPFNGYLWNGVSAPQLVASGYIGTGGFTATFHVPNDPIGSYFVYVTDSAGDNQSAGFELTHLVASAYSGAPLSHPSLSGRGFVPGTTVKFTIDGQRASTVAPCRTNSRGVFASCQVSVPNIPSGTHRLTATAGTTIARIDFTVT